MSLPAEALLPFIFGNGSSGGSQTITDYVASIGALGTVTLGTTWTGSDPYTSTVTVTGCTVTEKTLVNILPDSAVVEQMQDDGITEIYITNNGGTLTATAVGGAPTQAITLNVLCTESDFAADIDELSRQLSDFEETVGATYAKQDGSYDDLTVGLAKQLDSDSYAEDQVPYVYRQSGGGVEVGSQEEDMIVGGTVCWNQQIQNGNFADATKWGATGGALVIANNVASFTASGQYGAMVSGTIPLVSGHKYLFSSFIKSNGGSTNVKTYFGSYISGKTKSIGETWTDDSFIQIGNRDGNASLNFQNNDASDWKTIDIQNVCLFDLTKMFGTTIADYIYNLETATAGAGVAFFRKLFPKPYYAYNAGELMSVQAARHEMVGFNLWDEEWEVGNLTENGVNGNVMNRIRSKNYIPVKPSTEYAVLISNSSFIRVCFYREDKTFISYKDASGPETTYVIPEGCLFIRFNLSPSYGTTYNHDICISFSSDRNGEYEPYEKYTYPLDSSLTLRGIPKLDSNNKLYYDGDTYESDGTVTRKYGIVDLGALTWTYVDQSKMFSGAIQGMSQKTTKRVICDKYPALDYWPGQEGWNNNDKFISPISSDSSIRLKDTSYSDPASLKAALSGSYLVYELATPTTETAEPFHNPQIVSEYGTEEYVDTAVEAGTRDVSVPVGHVTKYPTNQVKKLDNLPSNFSTLIAPTEKTTTASQNYAVGSFLIYKNQLYKVTAAIASGGTITPGTNVTATTIIEQLMTLL